MSNVDQYLHTLVEEIGPRPTASDTERTAAEWIQSVFCQRGVESRIVDIDVPVSTTLSRGVAHLLIVAGVVLIGLIETAAWADWLAWAVLAAIGVCVFLESAGRKCPLSLSKKGPSQNVVARYAPHARHGDRLRKVVLVASYDSPTVPPLLSAATAPAYSWLRRLGRYYAYLAPVLGLFLVLPVPVTDPIEPWIWYLLLAGGVIPTVLSLNFLMQPAMKRYSPGANSNASGVAAMLAVLDDITGAVGTPSAHPQPASQDFGDLATFSVDTFAPSGQFASVSAPTASAPADDLSFDSLDDFGWFSPEPSAGAPTTSAAASDTFVGGSEPASIPVPPVASAPLPATVAPAAPAAAASGEPAGPRTRTARTPSLGTVEFAAVPEDKQQTVSFAPVCTPVPSGEGAAAFTQEDVLGPELVGGASTGAFSLSDFAVTEEKRSIFSFLKRVRKSGRRATGRGSLTPPTFADPSETSEGLEWLGMGDFDAKSAGQEIGSWDNYQSAAADVQDVPDGSDLDTFGDDYGWKGGAASGDVIEDPAYAEEQAARIRRRVSETLASDLDGKEIWFVATGASAERGAGMRHFLGSYGSELRGAVFINIDSVGTGNLHWYQREGLGLGVAPSPRLVAIARRAAKATGILAKGARGRDAFTEATLALKARQKAITITRLDASGLHGGGGCVADDLSGVDAGMVAEAARLVAQMVREV